MAEHTVFRSGRCRAPRRTMLFAAVAGDEVIRGQHACARHYRDRVTIGGHDRLPWSSNELQSRSGSASRTLGNRTRKANRKDRVEPHLRAGLQPLAG